ncbi:MAG: D-alanyl-D-alanine carboxypeptidase/D-alanyl-D-alanine-endopeptidase [Balneolaceae bacterium]|nr:D-alanyl-D-alanine carboxypeptidase/D-alanyl-D-alanine-endopeptidase [Balneolaceae bacterium]
MNYTFRFLPLLLMLFITEGLVAQSLSELISTSENPEAFWSVTVRNTDNEILESLHSDKLIIPASNQKLLTTAAVLDEFGGEYQFETIIYGEGSLEGNNWKGDLIIKGSGDPSISGDLYENNRYHVFEKLTGQLHEMGIERVTGRLLADVSLFDRQLYPKGWSWDDFSFYYGVQISPLSFNNNAVDLEVFAEGGIGETPRIDWFPDSTEYVEFDNQQLITHPDIDYDEYYRRALGANRIVLGSTLPKGYYEDESLSIHNPALFFLDSFHEYAEQNGIKIEGGNAILEENSIIETPNVLAIHKSKPLSELVAWANKESDNFYLEMFTKKLSATKSKMPGSFEDGILQVRTFLHELGIDTALVLMNDGSGMASGNYTTTGIISDVLTKMQVHDQFEAYIQSLAVSGVDGTLAHRTKGTEIYKKFRGKTGYVSGVRTLSGYLDTLSGDRIVVSIATNHYAGKVKPVDSFHEQILQYLYEKY